MIREIAYLAICFCNLCAIPFKISTMLNPGIAWLLSESASNRIRSIFASAFSICWSGVNADGAP